MFLDKPLQNYLDELASSNSTPGGGSTAALSGAMGAALACMVSRLTLGKAKYADVQAEIEALLQQAEQLRTRFQQLMQADIDAYGRLAACFKMPRTTDGEKMARAQAIQEQSKEAALVPLEMAERAVELVQCCKRIAEIGNVGVLSDIAAGAGLACNAAHGAAWMVRINLKTLKDQALVAALEQRLTQAVNTVEKINQHIVEIVGEKV